MPWDGSWNANRTAFIGTYTAGGTVYTGAWTPAPGFELSDPPGDPPLSNNDPFFEGAPTNDRDAHQDRWMGLWLDGIWRGRYKDPNSPLEISRTMTLHPLPTAKPDRRAGTGADSPGLAPLWPAAPRTCLRLRLWEAHAC